MRNPREKVEKMLDKMPYPLYNLKAVKNAAIAQSVERILGKDEVASSNLASSSKIKDLSNRIGLLFWVLREMKLATSSALSA